MSEMVQLSQWPAISKHFPTRSLLCFWELIRGTWTCGAKMLGATGQTLGIPFPRSPPEPKCQSLVRIIHCDPCWLRKPVEKKLYTMGHRLHYRKENKQIWRLVSYQLKKESEVAQSCPTLHDPTDCSPPGSSSMEFSRQEYWSGLPFPSPGDLHHTSESL